MLLDGGDIARLKTKDVAKRMGLLPQTPIAPGGPHRRRPGRPRPAPAPELGPAVVLRRRATIVAKALDMTGVADLAHRPVDSLSGGQRQRVWISMTLAQGTDLLLLDEPTTYLDLAHAIDVIDLVDDLHEGGCTIVMVLHDLNLAVRYSDNLIVMKSGSIVAQGHPSDVITSELLLDTFGLQAKVIDDPVSERPLIVPIGRTHVVSKSDQGRG